MKNLFLFLQKKAEQYPIAKQFIKFGIVGFSNTIVHFAIYYVLLLLGVHYLAAQAAGFLISVLNAFYWSKKFVFTESKKSLPKQLAKVYMSYSFSFVLSLITMFVMVDILGISELVAPIINLFITVPINFIMNKFWAFR